MDKISKSRTIINAFTGEIPYGEEWFEKRKSACDSCEYNSKNSKAESLKDIAQDILHAGVPYCRACLCFIDRKCAMKEETCGLKEIGLTPKWNALMVHTVNKEDWNIYNNTPEVCTIDLSSEGTAYIVDYGDITENSNTKIELELEGNMTIESVNVGCGACTVAAWSKKEKGNYLVTIFLKPTKIAQGKFRKNVYTSYKNEKGEQLKMTIGLTGKLK